MDHQLLISPEDVARRLGLSRSRTYVLVKAGTWPTVRVGRRVLIPADALQAWIVAQTSGGGR